MKKIFLLIVLTSMLSCKQKIKETDISNLNGYWEIEKVDLNIKNNNGMTALLIATYSNKRKYAEYLIKSGADKTIKNTNGEDFEKLQNKD